jgi:hypothetical protein
MTTGTGSRNWFEPAAGSLPVEPNTEPTPGYDQVIADLAGQAQPTGAVADVTPGPGPWESSWQAEIRFAAGKAAEVRE